MQIGIWLPVYGGWLRTLDQATGPDVAACLAIAQQAEALGFDFLYASENLLNCIHGPGEGVADAWSLLAAIAATTSRVGLAGAVKPGFRSPFLVARMIDTLTQVAGRRLTVNVVCGWWREEFELSGVPWLDHAGRYDRADAFLRSLYRLFDPPSQAIFETPAANGASGTIASDVTAMASPPNYGLDPASLPTIWISGHSEHATRLAAEWGDCLFLNGMADDELARHIAMARQAATHWGRRVSIALNAYVIATEKRAEAVGRRNSVVERRNSRTISFFRELMTESGAAAWANLNDEQMVDSNAGFDARLIGSFEDVQQRLLELAEIGVDFVVCQFDDPMRDAGPFMKHVIRPLRMAMAGGPQQDRTMRLAPSEHVAARVTNEQASQER